MSLLCWERCFPCDPSTHTHTPPPPCVRVKATGLAVADQKRQGLALSHLLLFIFSSQTGLPALPSKNTLASALAAHCSGTKLLPESHSANPI